MKMSNTASHMGFEIAPNRECQTSMDAVQLEPIAKYQRMVASPGGKEKVDMVYQSSE